MVRLPLLCLLLALCVHSVTVHVDYEFRCRHKPQFAAKLFLLEKDFIMDDNVAEDFVTARRGIVRGRLSGVVTDDGLFKDIVEMSLRIEHTCTNIANKTVRLDFANHDCIDNYAKCMIQYKAVLDPDIDVSDESSEEDDH